MYDAFAREMLVASQDTLRRRLDHAARVHEAEAVLRATAPHRSWWPRPRRLALRLAMAPAGLSPLADRSPCPNC